MLGGGRTRRQSRRTVRERGVLEHGHRRAGREAGVVGRKERE
jgi:hypothetical protein